MKKNSQQRFKKAAKKINKKGHQTLNINLFLLYK